jgi:hypothetical protein
MTDLTKEQEECFVILNSIADPLVSSFGYDEVYATSDYRENPTLGGKMVTLTEDEVMFASKKETRHYSLYSEVLMSVSDRSIKVRSIIEGKGRVRIRTQWSEIDLKDAVDHLNLSEERLFKALKRDQLEVDCI